MSVFIACPCYQGNIQVKCMECITALIILFHEMKIKYKFFNLSNESLISRARNVCASAFIKSDMDFMLFVDSDIIFRPSDVLRMMTHNKPVIAGVYPTKNLRFENIGTNR